MDSDNSKMTFSYGNITCIPMPSIMRGTTECLLESTASAILVLVFWIHRAERCVRSAGMWQWFLLTRSELE